ncbi:UDP-3-O-(3-hydroxymyristoyl)glucosamine N-acyltransferase [Siccirubricoccus phaeus]|uniref:UDP-3-O-(3-hydroxymyristoyl)glucosamine N-acyltransferase n=1 Tax=Siccirubricoccus phaeus TaxID=2595053 RepID=UPI0011F1B017|nr:UDP-3-O-(3-hydroxymyristoyl)glucosamine N-acyltransferase [Siccirubricoccus phaeus]
MAADPRFFASAGPQSLAAVAAAAGGRFAGDGTRMFTGVGPLQAAGPAEVSFLDNRRYLAELRQTRAGAVVLAEAMADQVPEGTVAIIVPAPYLGFARVAALFYPAPAAVPGVHPTAVIDPGAAVSPEAEIGTYAVIGPGAEIGPGCIIGPQVTIGAGCVLGPRCRIHAHASISHAILGEGVVLHPGARVGQEGFGFAPTPEGRFETMPQLGRVILGDYVEIGANACVDRGSQGDTVLGPGTRLDNLVQIGHNVRTGRGCIIVGQAGISGSTVLGDYVQVAAQAGLAGHLTVGSGARIGGQAGVMNDVAAKADVIGSPAMPAREFWRMTVHTRRLGEKQGKTE